MSVVMNQLGNAGEFHIYRTAPFKMFHWLDITFSLFILSSTNLFYVNNCRIIKRTSERSRHLSFTFYNIDNCGERLNRLL